MESLIFKNNTEINWERGLDGGGSIQYLDFLYILLNQNKKYKFGLEWCAGLGAIGFSIIDSNFCERMAFMDLYEPAESAIINNSIKNNIQDKVEFYHADGVGKLPSNLKFDLVIGNPPHCVSKKGNLSDDEHVFRLTVDTEWKIHSEFFSNIKNYLQPDADVFLSERIIHQTHIDMAEKSGLRYIGNFPAPALSQASKTDAVIMHYKI